ALVAGDAFTGELSRVAGENVGTYAIEQGDLELSTNYILDFTAGELEITELTIFVTADDQTKIYGDADPSLTYQFTPALVAGDAFTGELSRVAGENVGTYAIEQGDLELSTNYILDFTAGELAITKAELTVTADDKSRQYSDPNPEWTVSYDGFVFGEEEEVLDGELTFTGEGPDSDNTTGPGPYAITPGGLTSSNYAITFVNGTLTIEQEDAIITYIGDRLVATTAGSATLNLRAVIEDTDDGFPGEIINATVTFLIYNGEDTEYGPITITTADLVPGSNGRKAIVSVSVDVPIGQYNIQVSAGNYYTGDLDTDVIAVVYSPNGDHITGGGFIVPTEGQSSGTYASADGTHANFGFNFRYHPRTGALQGEANLVIRNDEGTFQFKSTEALAMGISTIEDYDRAQFTVRGELREGNNVLYSNLIMHATMEDHGNPGHNDEIGFTIWNGNVLIYSSNWTGTSTKRLNLSGGNIVIHRGGVGIVIEDFEEEVTGIFERETITDLAQQVELNVFPNPFREKLFIRFTPVKDTRAVLELYDMNGALVQTLFEGDVYGQERYEVEYIPRSRNSAVLFYRLRLGTEVINGKIIHQQ
ncbi:MAG: hypothetical protein K0B37_08410, partial [Bacteroidales bacterium]|nr:hypothetical protein [Bacteroidales bacterium]